MKKVLKKSEWRKDNLWRAVLSVAFFSVIVFTLYAIESNIDATYGLGELAPQNRIHHPNLRRPAALEPAAIATWMTFDYLNRIFKLPPEYLKASLSITDARYPRMTVKRYASDRRSDPAIVLTAVKAAVQAFLSVQNNATK